MTAKECIKGRRSIRCFKPDTVPPELIPAGCPVEIPQAPKRKSVDELLTFIS